MTKSYTAKKGAKFLAISILNLISMSAFATDSACKNPSINPLQRATQFLVEGESKTRVELLCLQRMKHQKELQRIDNKYFSNQPTDSTFRLNHSSNVEKIVDEFNIDINVIRVPINNSTVTNTPHIETLRGFTSKKKER